MAKTKSKAAKAAQKPRKRSRSAGADVQEAPSAGRLGRALRRLGALAASALVGTEDERTHGRLREIAGLMMVGGAIWLSISLASFHRPFNAPGGVPYEGVNWGGQLGFYLGNAVLTTFGYASWLCVLLGAAWGVVLLSGREVALPSLRVFGTLCLLFSAAFVFQLAFGADFHQRLVDGTSSSNLPHGPGGWLARELIGPSENHDPANPPLLISKFGLPGLWVLMLGISLSSFLLATERTFYPSLKALGAWLAERRETEGERPLAALGAWAARVGRGWWDFVSGADLAQVELAPAPPPSKAKPKKSASKKARKPKKKAEPEPEPEEVWEDEEEAWDDGEEAAADDGEWEDDGEEVWDEEDDDPEAAWEEYEEEEYEDEVDEDGDAEDGDVFAETDDEPVDPEPASEAALAKVKKATFKAPKEVVFDPPTPPPGPWKFPPIELLEAPGKGGGVGEGDRERIEAQASKLENALRSFRVEATVVGSMIGPSVTMFELEVAQGTRMNRVTTLSSEIAAALKARSVRIIAPIPGKSTIGIEVPNSKRRLVRFSELINQDGYDQDRYALPLFLGMDAEGEAIVEDLAKMPHLLIAGQTGAGKSVCINTIIASLLMTRSPHDVQMIMVDPKMVELAMYSNVPHQMCPVVTDMKHATNVLLWAVEKMEGRYDLFKNAGVRNIKGYNGLGEEKLKERMGDDFNEERTPRHVPYIVIIIDEMADLMMISKKEAEQAITRLAQKSRAVGIHVIVATQRPSTDVITGVLKANLPTRIAFTVTSKIDSRVILDAMGAEKLLGHGDMLYNPPQSSQLKRVQGALVEDHELQQIVDFVTDESAPTFSQELIQAASGSRSETLADKDPSEEDELWDQAVRVILKSKRGSASLLQRALGVGYTRASRLIDMMREHGIVGAHKGSKASEVLLTLDQWEEMHGSDAGFGTDDE